MLFLYFFAKICICQAKTTFKSKKLESDWNALDQAFVSSELSFHKHEFT